MAITSASEFEAVIAHVLIRIDKVLYERGDIDSLIAARRDFELAKDQARDASKLKPMRAKLEVAGDAIQSLITNDQGLLNDVWDLQDYVDYRA